MTNLKGFIPEKPEDYEITVPEGIPSDENFLNAFREVAHQARMTQEQVDAVSDFWNDQAAERLKEEARFQEEVVTALKGYWGADYDKNLELAKKAFLVYGGEDLVDFLEQSRLGDNPFLIRTFHSIGQALSEGAPSKWN